jgi:hypothetical protein
MPIDPEEAKRYLDSVDEENQVNNIVVAEKKTSLGKAATFQLSESSAGESPWKLLNLELLPSGGLFYPEGAELLIRSAKTKEIRHWSTIDENDPLDIYEKINFVLEACTKFKVKGSPVSLSYNDFVKIDRYHILFRIYELTFPNQENKLLAYIKCEIDTCGHTNKTQVTSQNLKGFRYPEELMKWYSPEERCFVIKSEKLGETLRFYLPTIGSSAKVRQKRKYDQAKGSVDEEFYEQVEYLIPDWRKADINYLTSLKVDSIGWSERKFLIVYKVVDPLKKESLNKVESLCEKCKNLTESSIFLDGSFTVKNIFIISAGLDELI